MGVDTINLDKYKKATEKFYYRKLGKVTNVVGLTLESAGPDAKLGDLCRIYTDGGATPFCGVTFVNSLCARSNTDRLTADQIWDKMMKEFDKLYEDTWLANMK